MQLAKYSFTFFIFLFLLSCFGPFKEIKYQIEDSWDDSESSPHNPKLLTDIVNQLDVSLISFADFDGSISKNLSPAITEKNFLFPSVEGHITNYNIEKNKKIWSYKHNSLISAGLSHNDKQLFFVDSQGFLCAIDLSNGLLEWKTFVGEVYGLPTIAVNQVFVKSFNGKIYALNSNDGSYNWSYQLPTAQLAIKSWGKLIFNDERIYSGAANGKILSINATNGSLVWETTYSQPKSSSELARANETTSDPVIDDFAIYVVSVNGNIASIEKNNGSIIWSRPLSSFYGMTINSSSIYVSHNSGAIYSLNKLTNEVLWRNSDLIGRDISKPIFYNNLIFVSDYEGYIHFLDSETGKIIARIKVSNSPVLLDQENILGDKIFISDLEGNIFYILLNKLNNEPHINGRDPKEQKIDKMVDENQTIQEDVNLLDKIIFWD